MLSPKEIDSMEELPKITYILKTHNGKTIRIPKINNYVMKIISFISLDSEGNKWTIGEITCG